MPAGRPVTETVGGWRSARKSHRCQPVSSGDGIGHAGRTPASRRRTPRFAGTGFREPPAVADDLPKRSPSCPSRRGASSANGSTSTSRSPPSAAAWGRTGRRRSRPGRSTRTGRRPASRSGPVVPPPMTSRRNTAAASGRTPGRGPHQSPAVHRCEAQGCRGPIAHVEGGVGEGDRGLTCRGRRPRVRPRLVGVRVDLDETPTPVAPLATLALLLSASGRRTSLLWPTTDWQVMPIDG